MKTYSEEKQIAKKILWKTILLKYIRTERMHEIFLGGKIP